LKRKIIKYEVRIIKTLILETLVIGYSPSVLTHSTLFCNMPATNFPQMKQVVQLSIGIPNSVGSMAHMTDMLRAADVNIDAMFCTENSHQTNVHLVVDDPETAKIVLQKIGPVQAADVLSLDLPNKPGSIAQIARRCAGAGINIRNIYATSVGKGGAVYLSTDDIERTKEILK